MQNTTDNTILDIAKSLVYGDRRADYGDVRIGFENAASIASTLTDKQLDAEDIVKIMIAVKLSRESVKHKRDNLIDAAGYLELLDILKEKS